MSIDYGRCGEGADARPLPEESGDEEDEGGASELDAWVDHGAKDQDGRIWIPYIAGEGALGNRAGDAGEVFVLDVHDEAEHAMAQQRV